MNRTLLKDKALMMEEIHNLVRSGKTVTIRIKGYSMNPFMVHSRDSITLGSWTDGDIRKGCVALVRDIRGNYLIHRIIKRNGNRITLMGDGNVGIWEEATTDNVIAIMHKVVRNGHTYSTDSFVWRAYSWIWDKLTPVRRYPLGLWRRLHKQEPL